MVPIRSKFKRKASVKILRKGRFKDFMVLPLYWLHILLKNICWKYPELGQPCYISLWWCKQFLNKLFTLVEPLHTSMYPLEERTHWQWRKRNWCHWRWNWGRALLHLWWKVENRLEIKFTHWWKALTIDNLDQMSKLLFLSTGCPQKNFP